jgi:1-acyl-sn-glycerol-3-phosphate acyltransferase
MRLFGGFTSDASGATYGKRSHQLASYIAQSRARRSADSLLTRVPNNTEKRCPDRHYDTRKYDDMASLFLTVYRFFRKRKRLLYSSSALLCIAIVLLASRLRFGEDISRFIPDSREMGTVSKVFRNLELKDRIVVDISVPENTGTDSVDILEHAGDLFASKVRDELGDQIRNVTYEISDNTFADVYGYIIENLPVFLEESDYTNMKKSLTGSAIDTSVKGIYKALLSPAGFAVKDMLIRDPLHTSGGPLSRLRLMQVSDNYEIMNGRIFTREHAHIIIFITTKHHSTDSANNAALIDGLDTIIENIAGKINPARISYFGAAAISVENARRIKKDTCITLSIAVFIIVAFITLIFRRKFISIAIVIPVLFGIAFSLALLYLIKGEVSAIAVGAGSIVFGIGLSYSIHLFSHFSHTRSAEDVIRELSGPMTIGSFTTVAGFLSLLFVSSEALRDFGLFSAFTLAGTVLFCLVIAPHFMKTEDHPHPHHHGETRARSLLGIVERIASYRYEGNRKIILLIATGTIVFLFFAGRTGFDSDLTHIQYASEKTVRAGTEIGKLTGNEHGTPVPFISTGRTLDEALVNQKLTLDKIGGLVTRGEIESVHSARGILIPAEEQRIRIARWKNFWTAERVASVTHELKSAQRKYRFRDGAFNAFLDMLAKDYSPVNPFDDHRMKSFFDGDWVQRSGNVFMTISMVKIEPEKKKTVYGEFGDMKNLVILDRPFFAKKFVRVLNSDFNIVLLICSIVVFLTLLITYGRIELAVLSFLPMVISWIWILGIMGILGIDFNIISIILATFIFGLGDDFSIFIMDGLIHEYRTGRKLLSSHKIAIFLSAFTTIVGVGVLIFAKHPALRSIAVIAVIGMTSVLFLSYTVQPYIFRKLVSGRARKGRFPHTLPSLLHTGFVFGLFLIGCMLLSLIGLPLFYLTPLPVKWKQTVIHFMLQKFCWILMYTAPNITKNLVNPHGENFKKPAVIIANHQSFLDILMLLLLSRKTIMLTTRWVWKSPFFGKAVHLAGFYPIEKGIEHGLPYLRKMTEAGYSIIVFPEGSRQSDCVIKRFRKGAFYIAEKLGLDILPIVIHGNGECMTKGDDFYLKSGTVTLKILPRIKPDDRSHGKDYVIRTKRIAEYFVREFEVCKTEMCVPSNHYFRYTLIKNYVFKGPILEWYMRIKTRMERSYALFHEIIPRTAVIVDIGCGYGFMAYMLTFMSDHRTVTGIDYDADKIAAANACFAKTNRQKFIHADVTTAPLPKGDVFILSDVLHYLSIDMQTHLIDRCMKSLRPGGILIVRDGDPGKGRKHRMTLLTEFLSTRIGFNKTRGYLFFMPLSTLKKTVQPYDVSFKTIRNYSITSNAVHVIRRK